MKLGQKHITSCFCPNSFHDFALICFLKHGLENLDSLSHTWHIAYLDEPMAFAVLEVATTRIVHHIFYYASKRLALVEGGRLV